MHHQQMDEVITPYVLRLHQKATNCEFEKKSLEEGLIENIIRNTPYEDFRKELLTRPKGYQITKVIERV